MEDEPTGTVRTASVQTLAIFNVLGGTFGVKGIQMIQTS
jgi:hypothetical protein